MAAPPRTQAQLEQLAAVHRRNADRHALEEAILAGEIPGVERLEPEPDPGPPLVSGEQTWLARNRARRTATREDIEKVVRSPLAKSHAVAGRITVEHETDEAVKMWKKTAYGWMPRLVPAKSIANNLANGFMAYCPDCGGTSCTADPNTCPAKVGRQFIVCPVPNCNTDGLHGPKKIYATGFGPLLEADEDGRPQATSEYQLANPYAEFTAAAELRAKMDQHLMTYHRDEARVLGLFSGGRTPDTRLGREIPTPGEEGA